MKNNFRNKNLQNLSSIREAGSKNYVDKSFNDPSIIKNTSHVDFNYKNLDNVRFIKINSIPTLEEHLTPKIYIDQVLSNIVDEYSLLRLDPNKKLKLNEKNSIVFISTLILPKTVIELPTKSYVDKKINDPSKLRKTAHFHFSDKKHDNVRFIKVNSMPAV